MTAASPAARATGALRLVLLVSVPTVLVFVLVLEGVLRMIGYVPFYLDSAAFSPSDDARAVYTLRPGFEGLYAGQPIRVNSRGFRGPELAPASAQAVRVAFVGDSIAFGQGVADADTLPAQVARGLEARLRSPVEAANLGVPGYDTCQSLARFESSLAAFKPGAAVLVYVDNDTEPSAIRVREGRVVSSDERTGAWGEIAAALRKKSRAYNLVWSNWQAAKFRSLTLDEYVRMVARRFEEAYPGWRQSRDCLSRMGALARDRSIRFIVIPFPPLAGLEQEPNPFAWYVERVCGAARAAGAECVDVVAALREPGYRVMVSHIERHPSAEVYSRVATRLLPVLAETRR